MNWKGKVVKDDSSFCQSNGNIPYNTVDEASTMWRIVGLLYAWPLCHTNISLLEYDRVHMTGIVYIL